MVEYSMARFRDAGSVGAGILIGLSILVPVYAMLVSDPGNWQGLWVFGSAVLLAVGLALQRFVTTSKRSRRADRELVAFDGCVGLGHGR